MACAKNKDNEDVIKLLLEYGADPNKVIFQNLSPLVCVAKDNKYELVKILLEYGAEKKINGKNIVDYHMELTNEIKELLTPQLVKSIETTPKTYEGGGGGGGKICCESKKYLFIIDESLKTHQSYQGKILHKGTHNNGKGYVLSWYYL